RLQELHERKEIRRFLIESKELSDLSNYVRCLALRPDGLSAVSYSFQDYDHSAFIDIWNLAKGDRLDRRRVSGGLNDPLFSPDGSSLVGFVVSTPAREKRD